MGRELEYKFTATEAVLEALARRYPKHQVIEMATTYYDNAARDLARAKSTLRLRLENGRSVCTLKRPLLDGSRAEWEVEAGTIEEANLPLEVIGPFFRVCGARFTRRAVTLQREDSTLELALDRGVLLGIRREQPLCEVEVEHKSGSEAATWAFAQALAREFRLKIEEKSKFARAMALAEGENI